MAHLRVLGSQCAFIAVIFLWVKPLQVSEEPDEQ